MSVWPVPVIRTQVLALRLGFRSPKLFWRAQANGHAAGDQALAAVAQILADNARPLDVTARIGGEEFVMLLDNVDMEQALGIAGRIRESVQLLPPLAVLPGRGLTISVGVALMDERLQNAGALLEEADQALYRAKAEGRNRVCQAMVQEAAMAG